MKFGMRYGANFLTYLITSLYAILTFIIPRFIENKTLIYDVLIAEDGFYINCYNSKPILECLVEGYRGWLHVPSMIISAIIYQFPIQDWAILNFLFHMILLALFACLTYFSLNQLIKSRVESLLLTLIIFSNPLLQIESIHQTAALYTYMIIPLIVSVLRVNLKKTNFLIALILIPASVTWQFDTFFLATIVVAIILKQFVISKRTASLVIVYIMSLIVVLMSNNLEEASSRILNLRVSMVTESINSVLTLIPMLGLGEDWPYMSSPNQTFNSNYITLVTSITFIAFCFLSIKHIKKLYLSSSKSIQIIRDITILVVLYQLCIILFLQSAARNVAVFQTLLILLIYLKFKQKRNFRLRYLGIVLFVYSMLSMNQVDKLKSHISWTEQVNANQLICQKENNDFDVTFYLPIASIANMTMHCDDLNLNR